MDEEFTCDLLQITKMHKDNYYLALTHPHWWKIVKNCLINRIRSKLNLIFDAKIQVNRMVEGDFFQWFSNTVSSLRIEMASEEIKPKTRCKFHWCRMSITLRCGEVEKVIKIIIGSEIPFAKFFLWKITEDSSLLNDQKRRTSYRHIVGKLLQWNRPVW